MNSDQEPFTNNGTAAGLVVIAASVVLLILATLLLYWIDIISKVALGAIVLFLGIFGALALLAVALTGKVEE